MYYCTHSDKNYVKKGIALCKSIIEHDRDAVIFYLCLDNETYNTIENGQELFYDSIITIPVMCLEKFDEKIIELKNCKPSNYGTAHSQYCWSLTPCFIWFLFKNFYNIEEILYCDADIYFYDNPKLIFDACKNHSVGIHSHGFSSYDVNTNDVGEFNVGCVYFKNDSIGYKVSEFWKNCLLNPENEYAQKYGTCGDQKYLDLFIPLFGKENIAVFDRDTNPKIHHLAPWNYSNYTFDYDNNKIYYEGKEIKLLFNHFSHFKHDENGWSSSDHGEWAPEAHNQIIYNLYNQYYNKINEKAGV